MFKDKTTYMIATAVAVGAGLALTYATYSYFNSSARKNEKYKGRVFHGNHPSLYLCLHVDMQCSRFCLGWAWQRQGHELFEDSRAVWLCPFERG
jgi:hypothetical protein